jgi:GNAT superfamily N-acetyltransferase
MIDVRRAGPADADELIRLRAVMIAGMTGTEPTPGPWQRAGADLLRRQLDDPAGSTVAFVVDVPGPPQLPARAVHDRESFPLWARAVHDREPLRLAACVVGAIDQRLPGPHNPTGRIGYVYNVATDPGHRRRGYSRACLTALLSWFDGQGVTTVDLRASADGEPLYADVGFVRTRDPAMRRTRLPPDRAPLLDPPRRPQPGPTL